MLKFLLPIGLSLGLMACSTKYTQFTTVKNPPKIAPVAHSIATKQQCVIQQVKNSIDPTNQQFGIALFIRDISDSRVSGETETITMANRIYLSGSLFKLHNTQNQLMVMDNMPKAFRDEGVLETGYPDTDALLSISENLKKSFSHRNQPKDSLGLYIIDASFTRFDKDGNKAFGYGVNAEYNKNSSAEVEFGNTKENKYMSLTVNIINAFTNNIEETETFDILISKDKRERTVKLVRKGFGLGLTDEISQIESIHSAQNVLLDYASMWIIDQFTSNNRLKNACQL